MDEAAAGGAAGRQLPHEFRGVPAAWGATSGCWTAGSPGGTNPTRENPPRGGWSPGSPQQSSREQPDSEWDVCDPGMTLRPQTAESSSPFHHPQQFHSPTKHENFPLGFVERRTFYLL